MRKLFARVGAFLAIASLAVTAVATPGKDKKPPKDKPVMCPVCKTMALSTKKTKANPTMVKIGGKTYYCCAKCKMPKPK